MAIIVVLLILAVITYVFRVFALKMYKKNLHIEELAKEKRKAEMLEKQKAINSDMSDEELVAVLTAAAMSYLQKAVVVRNIQFLRDNQDSAWARMGRLSVMSSHQLR